MQNKTIPDRVRRSLRDILDYLYEEAKDFETTPAQTGGEHILEHLMRVEHWLALQGSTEHNDAGGEPT